jgi:hypothetical protein
LWVLEAKGWLHVASHSLLTEKVGNVIGAEGAGSMSLTKTPAQAEEEAQILHPLRSSQDRCGFAW